MRLLPHDDLSLYIHVPFCTNRCRYCGFYLETTRSPFITNRYIDLLLAEARAAVEAGWIQPKAIRTVYVGGGTPSLLTPADLERLFGGLANIFGDRFADRLDEFCFEANPESLDRDKLEVLADLGVDRISLGVQSFDEARLRFLDRRANPQQIREALNLLAEHWPRSFGADLISGIPGGDRFGTRDDVRQLVSWKPHHISMYDLTVEDGTALAQLVKLPLERGGIPEGWNPAGKRGNLEGDLGWQLAVDELEGAGHPRYELSNFARQEHQSAHNLRYWTMSPWLGLGPGSVSNLHSADGPLRVHSPDIYRYGRGSGFKGDAQLELLSAREYLSDHILTATRTTAGLDLALVDRRFKLPDGTAVSKALASAITKIREKSVDQQRGATSIAISNSHLVFTGDALTFHNSTVLALEEALDSVLIDSPIWCP